MSQQHLQGGGAVTVTTPSSSVRRDGDFTVPATPPPPPSSSATTLTSSAAHGTDNIMKDAKDDSAADNGAATVPQTVPNSQESNVPAADSTTINGSQDLHAAINTDKSDGNKTGIPQHAVDDGAVAGSRKRMADGVVKRNRSTSPVKGHARSVSTISMTSTGSNIGEMSAELRTRLTYAMVKVNNGWQSRSLHEVESLASHAASPTSSSSTIYRRQGSSASPNLPPTPPSQVHFAPDLVSHHPPSHSPKSHPNKPMLAPPAPIQPATSIPNARRNTHSRNPPSLVTSHSASASTHEQERKRHADAGERYSSSQPVHSPHQNVRDQDAIEALLFMSSPGNSTNMKHAFSPSVSPAPQHEGLNGFTPRHVLPESRRTLPGGRPSYPSKKTTIDRSPAMVPPHSPMDLDSPQAPYHSPSNWTPKRRVNGVSGHMRGALSLPNSISVSATKSRQALQDADIERMLDRAAADSSDDEEIPLPSRTNGVARALGI